MIKKVLCMLLAGMMLAGLAGCGEAAQPTEAPPCPTEATEAVRVLTEEEQQILTQRREAVVQRMRDMTTFLWRSDVDITYSKQRQSNGLEADDPKNVMTLKAGRLYSGLPYTHGGSSMYDWQLFATEVDEKGIYHVSGITGQINLTLGRIELEGQIIDLDIVTAHTGLILVDIDLHLSGQVINGNGPGYGFRQFIANDL